MSRARGRTWASGPRSASRKASPGMSTGSAARIPIPPRVLPIMSSATGRAMIPVSRPFFGTEEEAAVTQVLRSGWVTQGPRVAEFEHAFAAYVGAREAVAVTSCTAGLHLLLHTLGIGPGD